MNKPASRGFVRPVRLPETAERAPECARAGAEARLSNKDACGKEKGKRKKEKPQGDFRFLPFAFCLLPFKLMRPDGRGGSC